MSTLRRILTVSALAVMAVGMASADSVITQNFTLPSGSDATNWTQSGTINQFDTSLGTLEFIEFTVSASTTVSGSATDANSGSTGTDVYNFLGTTNMTVSDPSNTLILAPTTTVTQTFSGESFGSSMSVTAAPGTSNTTAQYIVDTSYGGGFPAAFLCTGHLNTPGCLLGSPAGGQTDPLNYGAYEGVGTIAVSVSAATFAAFSGPAYTGGSGSGTADVSVQVQYDYVPVGGAPEPATLVLFGSALIGLGCIRKRIGKKS